MADAYRRWTSGEVAGVVVAQKQRGPARFPNPSDGIPGGYRIIPATVYTDGKSIVVTARPDDISGDVEWHNCDAMGCGWEHVVAIAPVEREDGRWVTR